MNSKFGLLVILFISSLVSAVPREAVAAEESAINTDESFLTERARESARNLSELKDQLRDSPFVIKGGAVAVEDGLVNASVDSRKFSVAQTAFNEIKGAPIANGTKVLVLEDGEHDVVVFDLALPENASDGDFSYKIVIDRKSGEVLRRIVGG